MGLARAHSQAPASPAEKNCLGKANKAKIQAYVVLPCLRWDIYAKWKETGVWPDDAEANKALEGHSAYWTQQLKSGRAIIAGCMNGDYWHNAAMIVFEAGSPEEAETVLKNDPAGKAHAFQAQVRPFGVFWLPNKFEPGADACRGAQSPSPK
jgi:hypothetical protein